MENDISLEAAKKMVKESGKKFVWVGAEAHFSIAKNALEAGNDEIMCINPRQLLSIEDPKKLEGAVFVCYHGNTSGAVVNYLNKAKVQSYNLKGGITSIVGEIF